MASHADARRSRRALLGRSAATVAGLILGAACGLGDAPALPAAGNAAIGTGAAVASPQSAEAIRSGIQETLDRQATARARADRDAFMATIDQRNLTWRRIQGDAFAAETARGPRSPATYTVTRIQPKELGYVKAWIDVAPAGGSQPFAHAVWVFRQAGSTWLHSEILNDELGRRKTMQSAHFRLLYYAWDDDVIGRTAAAADRAYERVTERTGLVPGADPVISVNPTYASHAALRGYGTWALYLAGTDTIVIRSMESYGAGTTAPGETQEARLLVALTHEYAHLVNNYVVPTVKMPKWMVEGFAEFVADNLRGGSMLAALRSGRTLTLDQASEIIEWGNDPSRGFSNADVDLAYAHSAHATAYFMERYGQDRFFELAADFAESRRWGQSLARVVGIAPQEFERDWLAWTRRHLGA